MPASREVEGAVARRKSSEAAKAASVDMLKKDDLFTTCRKCGKRAPAKRDDSSWVIGEHECGA